jgi:hypothetical protein
VSHAARPVCPAFLHPPPRAAAALSGPGLIPHLLACSDATRGRQPGGWQHGSRGGAQPRESRVQRWRTDASRMRAGTTEVRVAWGLWQCWQHW